MPASRRFPGALWRHSPFLVVLVLAMLLRAAAWYAVSPGWWILGDTIGYIFDAVHLRPDLWRPSGYSLLVLRPLLRAHDLSLVTAVQHLMGLLVAVAVYATMLRLSIPSWGALLATLPPLFDGYVVGTEQMLASEALFGALVAGAVVTILWRADGPGWFEVLLAGLLLGLSAITRITGLPLVAVLLVALLLRGTHLLRVLALCVAFAVPVAAYSYWFHHWYGRVNLTASSGIFMYGRASNFVDCGRVSFPDERLRDLCPTEPVGQRNEYFYMFDANSPLSRLHLNMVDSNEMAGRFAAAVISAQPADYVRQALQGTLTSFRPQQDFGPDDVRFAVREPLPGFASYVGAEYQAGRDPGPRYRPYLVGWLARYQSVAFVPGTVCALVLALAVVAFALDRNPKRRRLRSALVLTAGTAAVLLIVPAVTAIPAPRYRVPALPELSLAAALGCRILLDRWRTRPRLPVSDVSSWAGGRQRPETGRAAVGAQIPPRGTGAPCGRTSRSRRASSPGPAADGPSRTRPPLRPCSASESR